MKNKITYFLLICGLLAVTATSCKDDLLYADDGPVPEGEAMVTARIDFRPLAEGLGAKSRTAGDVIKSINDLYVLLYNTAGELVEARSLTETQSASAGENQFYVNDITRKDEDADNGKAAELKTPSAHLKLTVPYGRYYIYAVANMGEDFKKAVTTYKEEDHTSSESVKSYWNAIQKRESLKAITLTWKTEVVQNNQMFGCFTLDGETTEESLLTINKKDMKLHSWIRRAASKVTIAYDGSDLKENVYIYLKSVQIKDIPTECYLGKESAINKDAEDKDHNFGDLIADGEMITYVEGASYNENWPARITKGRPYYYTGCSTSLYEKDVETFKKEAHTETVNALYFYENMQGEGKDKRQDADGKDGLDAPGLPGDPEYKYKDDKPYGTYIEVKAYYVSNAEGRVGSGDIIYRFMLGKNVTTDYNAERNYHYKLTLKFNKFANDVDWHIEYEEEVPGIELPQQYYISYLYNRTMNLPIKINARGGKLTSLQARIISSNWAPYGTLDASEGLDYARQYDYAKNPTQENLNMPWNGFLSLRKTSAIVLTDSKNQANASEGVEYAADNREYYYGAHKADGTADPDSVNRRDKRIYYQGDVGLENKYEGGDAVTGSYWIDPSTDNSVINASIPLYTRAKQMIISTGYTGNNPYVAYRRRAEIEIRAKLVYENGLPSVELIDTTEIFQVRRVVNPKGIYRSHDNDKPFHVTLMVLPRENATTFVPFSSEGPWRAEIVAGDENFITLDGKTTIEGKTGTNIDFEVEFNGKCEETKSRFAVIRVEYHNYTCDHLIFVSQGDAPVQLVEGGAKWHTKNLVTASTEANNPLDEGSLFKWGNLSQPILASNQKNSKSPWINVVMDDFKDARDVSFDVGTGSVKWNEITNKQNNESWDSLTGNLENARIASYDDYRMLFATDAIKQAYGVLYGDLSTTTATALDDVYQYQQSGTETMTRGMRGCFVYNSDNGRYIFFPLGASGYGHRKNTDFDYSYSSDPRSSYVGVLRYAVSRNRPYPDGDALLARRPLFYDLYMRPGAVYWLQNEATDVNNNKVLGWDINYFTFDFNKIETGNIYKNGKSDACFIRCVEDPN